ncbi:MAG: TIGR04283 family arsenosugar biosynthesis glycosyltransferase [Deltaproteobacteria bacterium]|nr:TIGR04283 family arsenosugar biosynthesis glycosyltransferase [Deltaproteobacteria bacterium]
MRLTIIIPTLDEEASVAPAIRSCREAGPCEVVVVDGGSRDRTVEIARGEADTVISASRGRAVQMNAGAAVARGEALLFLHADTLLPLGSVTAVLDALRDPAVIGGAFRVRLAPSSGAGRYVRATLAITGRMIGARGAVSRSYSGDQAIFLRKETFCAVGGYPEIPLMEDVELSRRMRRAGKTVLLPMRVETSGRRWEAWGPFRTVLFMWRLRIGHLLGRTPSRSAEAYRRGPA